MQEKNKNQSIIDSYDYLAHAASTTDCTGLIPTLAKSPDERDSYEELYPYQPPTLSDKNGKNNR